MEDGTLDGNCDDVVELGDTDRKRLGALVAGNWVGLNEAPE